MKYRCDKSMARKKGIYYYCDRKCKGCLCALVIDASGRESHTPDLLQPCGNVAARNVGYMSGERYGEQQRKGKKSRA